MTGALQHFRRMHACQSGMAAVEFALSMPLLLTLFLGGGELTNNIMARKRITEIAMMVADNAARMGDDTVLSNKPITEAEINEVFLGAQLQSGSLDLATNGRIVLSSLEQNDDDGQWIHWQRCFGAADYDPPDPEGTGESGTGFAGMGPEDSPITASADDAVMHVTVVYDYTPLVPVSFAGYDSQRFTATAAFNVRDDRDLSGPTNPTPAVTVNDCD